MKQFLAYMIMTLAALWTVGCSDDSLSDSPTDLPERGIVIRLSTGDLETRTDLTSQANLQHVTEVYAVLYKGTGDDATFESVEKLDWNPSADDYGIQKEDFILPQTATESLLARDYTVLCVGLDDKSGETYGLTAETMKWSTLAEAKATLAAGMTADDIAHSELFAGWAEFDFEPDNINIVEVEMKRRVAGVLCYLKDIPSTLTKSDGTGTYTVTKVLLRLFSDQCNSIALPRKEKSAGNTGSQADFGEGEIADSDVLMSYDLSKCKDLDSDGLYEITVADESRLSNTILMGAYMLPIEYSSQDNKPTFTLEIWGIPDKSGSGIIPSPVCVQSFPVYQNGLLSGSDAEKYSIYPNYIYHIGDKPDPNSTDGDQPMSLAGTKITVKPEPWTEMDVDVDFPSVPLMATMDCPTGIFDCVKSEFNITVKKSILNNNWKLTISGDGLYVKGKDGNYTKNYPSNDNEAKEGAILTFVWVDYRDKNSSNQNDPANDYRTAIVKLETLDDQGALVGSNTEELRQYNAVIVSVGDEKRGFRRLNGEPAGWGYWSSAATASTIYAGGSASYDDGKENYINASSKAISGYEGSLIQKSYLPIYEVSEGKLKALAEFWYLPAPDEMTAFLSLAKDNKWLNLLDVKVYSSNASQNRYWTSVGRWSRQSEASYVTSLEKVGYDLYERENKFYARQACHL